MVHLRAFVVCLLGPVPTYGHFILQNPKSHGFVDVLEGVSPCGSFEITDRETVTPWFIAGSVVDIVTTHDQATWSYKAALLNDTSTWIDLQPGIRQQGMGDFCLPAVPGPEHWIDLDGVVQVIQHADDGDMYQCAAVKFTGNKPAPVTPDCQNSTEIVASFLSTNSSSIGSTGNESSSGGHTGSGSLTPSKSAAVGLSKELEDGICLMLVIALISGLAL